MTENSPNLPRRLTTTTVIVTHVLNVVSKAILNLSVLSTFRKHGDEKKGKKDRKEKKTYIACEDSASTTSNSSSDEEIANTCLMEKSINDPSTSEEIEVNSNFEELLEAFNEMNGEAQRLVVLNKKLKSELKLHANKLSST